MQEEDYAVHCKTFLLDVVGIARSSRFGSFQSGFDSLSDSFSCLLSVGRVLFVS